VTDERAPIVRIDQPTEVRPEARRPRRRAVIAVLVVTLILAGAIGGAAWLRSRNAADPTGATAWESVLDHIAPDGEVSFEAALDAFSLAVGPLPGVAMPAGRRERIPSGTGPIRWLGGYRDRLTDAQRVAFDRYLAPDPGAIRVEPSGAAAPTSPTVVLAAYREPRSPAGVPRARTLIEDQLLRYLDDARGEVVIAEEEVGDGARLEEEGAVH